MLWVVVAVGGLGGVVFIVAVGAVARIGGPPLHRRHFSAPHVLSRCCCGNNMHVFDDDVKFTARTEGRQHRDENQQTVSAIFAHAEFENNAVCRKG